MIKRPLLVAGIVISILLCILAIAGFPGIGEPAGQELPSDYVDHDRTVNLIGHVYRRSEKEKSNQYYIKDAYLVISEEQVSNQNSIQISNSQSGQKSNTESNQNSNKQSEQKADQQSNQTVNLSLSKRIMITTEKDAVIATLGSVIRVQGSLETFESPGNPGQFDSVSYYAAQGISYTMWAESFEVLKQKDGIAEKAEKLRKKMLTNLTDLLPKQEAGVLGAMLLGDKSELDAETKVNYEAGSLLHMISISGLHLMLLGMGVYRLLLRIRMPKIPISVAPKTASSITTNKAVSALPVIPASVMAAILMAGYCWFTGSQTATLRALCMFCVVLGAKVTGRSYDSLSSMSLALILMLLENHCYIFYSGFQLSFVAVLGASVIYPIWRDGFGKRHSVRTKKQKFLRLLWDQFLSCLVITLTTLPLTCYYFYEIPLLGIFANVLILPTLNGVMIPGALASVMSLFSKPIAGIIIFPAGVLLQCYEWLLKAIRLISGSVYICGQPKVWQIVVYYCALIMITCMLKYKTHVVRVQSHLVSRLLQIASGEQKRKIKGFSLSVMFLMCLLLVWRTPVELSITALDVGQGDSIVLRSGKLAYLVDGGSSSEKKVGAYRILPYLKSQGIGTLDGIIVTHPDQDHISGILEMLEAVADRTTFVRIRHLYLPSWMQGTEEEQEFLELAEKAGIPVSYLKKGMRLTKGELCMEVLHPDVSDYSEDTNAGSIVLGVHYGEFDALLTGDVEGAGEETLVRDGRSYEYLKVSHHGSKNATGEALLQVVDPQIAVISCGEGNIYGHPAPETMERLDNVGCKVFSTMQKGQITIEVMDEKKYKLFYHSLRKEKKNG